MSLFATLTITLAAVLLALFSAAAQRGRYARNSLPPGPDR